jgi:hypothetical protein
MLSIERVKELIEEPITDEEAQIIRDGLYDLAKVIFEKWRLDNKSEKQN